MRKHEAMLLALVGMGILSIDAEGRVWRHKEMTRGSRHGGRWVDCEKRRADTGRSKKAGYLRVQATVGNVRYTAPAHRIVWMVANRRPIPSGLDVNHRNGTKDDNRPENLELATRAENVVHWLHELEGYQESRGGSLTPEQALKIRDLCDAGELSRVEIAQLFQVSAKTVSKIATRQTWTWIPERAPASTG